MIIYHRMPVLFHVGSLTVYSWGFFVSLGVLVALLLSLKEYKKESPEVVNSLVVLIPFALLGARTFYVLSHWDFYSQHLTQILNFPGGGLDLPGALLFGFLAFVLYFKLRHLDYKHYLDIFAIYIPLAQAIGRIGCFFNGCCYGSLTNLPWGITYQGGIRHPAQLYESVLDFSVFLYLHHTRNNKTLRLFNKNLYLFPGAKFLLYLILYSTVRFICEFFRIEPRVFHGFTVMHIVSFIIIVSSLFLLFLAQPKNRLKIKGKIKQPSKRISQREVSQRKKGKKSKTNKTKKLVHKKIHSKNRSKKNRKK